MIHSRIFDIFQNIGAYLKHSQSRLVGSLFFVLGFLQASWIIRIPQFYNTFEFTPIDFSIAMLLLAFGVGIGLRIAKSLLSKQHLGKTLFKGVWIFCLTMLLPGLAWNGLSLFVFMMIAGLGDGVLNHLTNQASLLVEKSNRIRIQNIGHGFFSLGGLFGASIGWITMYMGWPTMLHMGLLVMAIMYLVYRFEQAFDQFQWKNEEHPNNFFSKSYSLSVQTLVFIVWSTEIVIGYWNTIYLMTVRNTTPLLASLGFVTFMAAMSLGRFYGDYAQYKRSYSTIILYGFGFAILGTLSLVTIPNYGLNLLSIAAIGWGLSSMIPQLFEIPSATKVISTHKSISWILFLSYLLAPISIGLVSYLLGSVFVMVLLTIIMMGGLFFVLFKRE